MPAGLVSAAKSAADALGLDLDDLIDDGVDTVLRLVGIGLCSDANKRKYRRKVDGASNRDLQIWLNNKRVDGATGSCNEYALAQAARRVQSKVRAAQRREDDVRRRMAGPFPTENACIQALREQGLTPADVTLRTQLARDCARWGGRPPPCTVPASLQVAGIATDGWCLLSDIQRAELRAGVESVELSDSDRRRLLALPIAEGVRRMAFLELAKGQTEGGMPGWLKLLIALAIVGAIVAAVVKLSGGSR